MTHEYLWEDKLANIGEKKISIKKKSTLKDVKLIFKKNKLSKNDVVNAEVMLLFQKEILFKLAPMKG